MDKKKAVEKKVGRESWREVQWGMGNLNTFDIVRSLWEQLVSWEEQGSRRKGERSWCTGVKMGLESPHYDWGEHWTLNSHRPASDNVPIDSRV